MENGKENELPDRLEDTDILHAYEVKPDNPKWRELMLDLGVPLETQWSLTVCVSYGRSTEDPLSHQLIEAVSIIMSSDFLSEEYNAEIERVNPLYVERYRSFYFDHRPTHDEVPSQSPIIPETPCVESKHKRIKRWEPGDPAPGTMAFYCPGSNFEEVMHSLKNLHRGYVCSRYWGSGKNPLSKQTKRKRSTKFSKEEYRVKFLAVARELAKSGCEMTPSIMASLTDIRDIATYKKYMERDPELWGEGCDLWAKTHPNLQIDG